MGRDYGLRDQPVTHQNTPFTLAKTQTRGRRVFLLATGAGLVLTVLVVLLVSSANQVRSLLSFRKVDDYPLYVMHLYGDNGLSRLFEEGIQADSGSPAVASGTDPQWACTVFATLNGNGDRLLGRNFDWHNRPTLVLFTHPPAGFDAVSMVDISYLGFERGKPSWSDRLRLLDAAHWPFDGMNEHGLAVGMMAVSRAKDQADPGQATIGSLHAMRLILDRARTVDEAIALLRRYNLDFGGGPPLHYLIADAAGSSAIVEFIQGEMVVSHSKEPWQVATNFVVSGHNPSSARSQCRRYAHADTALQQAAGLLSQAGALALLQDVSQPITMWSVVYGLSSGKVSVVMGRDYDQVHRFQIPLQERPDGSEGSATAP